MKRENRKIKKQNFPYKNYCFHTYQKKNYIYIYICTHKQYLIFYFRVKQLESKFIKVLSSWLMTSKAPKKFVERRDYKVPKHQSRDPGFSIAGRVETDYSINQDNKDDWGNVDNVDNDW